MKKIKNLYGCSACGSVFVGKQMITDHECKPEDEPELVVENETKSSG